MQNPPGRHVEQIEIIETHVTESRRPISSQEALNYRPFNEERSMSETFTTQAFMATPDITSHDLDNRYLATGERDYTQEPSVLNSTAIFKDIPINCPSQLDRSLNSTGVQNFGYDVNEVHTTEGGARVVTQHGNKDKMNLPPSYQPSSTMTSKREAFSEVLQSSTYHPESSYTKSALANQNSRVGFSTLSPFASTIHDTTYHQSKINSLAALGMSNINNSSPPLQSILKHERNSWQQSQVSDDNSQFSRKDSYKKMQESQQFQGSAFGPKSQTSLISNTASAPNSVKWTGNGKEDDSFLNKNKKRFYTIFDAFKNAEWTPKLICNICLIITFFLLGLIILFIVLSALFHPTATRDLLLFPPACEECLKKNPNAQSLRSPSHLYAHYYSHSQAHFELIGNLPLKSNSFTAIDFATGWIAIADHALTNDHGVHTTCFLMPLDRSALPEMEIVMDALSQTKSEEYTQFGWQEYWQYSAESIDSRTAQSKFTTEIEDCKDARWIQLKHTLQTRDGSCSDCWDFCLPDYAVQRRQKYEDESIIGIRRLNCFRYYVPEWAKYSIRTDATGGHWQYPRSQTHTARDEHGQWVGWISNSERNF